MSSNSQLSERVVLSYLAEQAGSDQRVQVKMDAIAAATHIDKSTVFRALGRLRQAKRIEYKPRRGKTTTYYILAQAHPYKNENK